MISEKEMQQRLKAAVAGNISQWCRENKLWGERANISLMMCGERSVSKEVAKALGYRKRKAYTYEPIKPK